MLSGLEVAKHNSRESCWIIVKGNVYDVTGYLDSHPGGSKILLNYAGKDATEQYEPIHLPGTIENTLALKRHLGPVDRATVSSPIRPQVVRKLARSPAIPLQLCLSLADIEAAAEKVISRRAWTYFHSAADGLGSLNNNRDDWRKVMLRPRILRNVQRVNMRRTILDFNSSLPFCIAPAALAKLAHPDGELCLARAAARRNIPYCVSTAASVSHDDLAACVNEEAKGGCLFFQLYIQKERPATLDLIAKAKRLGFKALVVTVDTPVVGKREEDERYKAEVEGELGVVEIPRTTDTDPNIEQPVLRGYHSSTFSWHDLTWVRDAWSGPLVIKGIQTAEDAKLCCDYGVDAIYLSNHGGRQCDDAPSAIRTLVEIRKFCPEILSVAEIWLDGGIRRGADIVKGLCLGATTVLIGRPFLYALGAHGTDGVLRAIQILSDEIETTMRLIGATSLSRLHPDYVDSIRLEHDLPDSLSAFSRSRGSRL